VVQGLSRGESNKAIARRLGIRDRTIKVHVHQIMRKLGVANRTQVAIAYAERSLGERVFPDGDSPTARSSRPILPLSSSRLTIGITQKPELSGREPA
jgi:regulatory LuxR family protein